MRAHHKPAKSTLGRRYIYKPPHHYERFAALCERPLLKLAPLADQQVDMRPLLLMPRDQGAEGACSGFATAALDELLHALQASIQGPASALYSSPAYLYGKTRQAEGTFPEDSGCSISDEMATLHSYGVCSEEFLPYTGKADEAPTPACDVAAAAHRCAQPLVVDWSSADYVRQVLSNKMPVVIGICVYESFERTGADGIVPDVDPSEGLVGGHALLVVGFDAQRRWIVRNSWGTGWGLGGYCLMPEGYTAHWMEAWTVQSSAA